jgi:hypothetical protein
VTDPEMVPVGFGTVLPPMMGRPWRAAHPPLNINSTTIAAAVRWVI